MTMHTGIDTAPRITWPDRWAILFGYPPDEPERDALQAWLDEQFPSGWQPDELHAALDAYAERERKGGKRAKAPTGPQLKSAIIRARHERRHADGMGGAEVVRWYDRDRHEMRGLCMSDVREMIRRATPEGRWDIICDVGDDRGQTPRKDALASFAEGLPGGLVRFNPQEAAGGLAGVKTGAGPGLGVGRATGAATGAESACEDDGMGEEWM